MTDLIGLPVTEHPRFGEFWDRYVNRFNDLAVKLEKAGIEIEELNNVIDAACDVERLSFRQFFRMCGLSLTEKEYRAIADKLLQKVFLARCNDAKAEEGHGNSIGERIRNLRVERGLSVRGLAQKAGVSASLLSNIENKKGNPSIDTLVSIAKALGVFVGSLFGEKAEDKNIKKSANPLAVGSAPSEKI